jgi:hypothetical protein
MHLPHNLLSLHRQEEQLRAKADELVAQHPALQLHLAIIESAMNVAHVLHQFPTADENLKVVQILGMRTFNAFGASLKLALSGYFQNSALVMRDVLETAFLLDLFRGEPGLIEKWRFADSKLLREQFSPVAVRKALDDRHGHTERRREQMYKLFSELAAHPTMKSSWMMRPEKNGDAVNGPFMEPTSLEAVISEMGRLAIQTGQHLIAFFPDDWAHGLETRVAFGQVANEWLATFYPNAGRA